MRALIALFVMLPSIASAEVFATADGCSARAEIAAGNETAAPFGDALVVEPGAILYSESWCELPADPFNRALTVKCRMADEDDWQREITLVKTERGVLYVEDGAITPLRRCE